jgi:hypothetical protein
MSIFLDWQRAAARPCQFFRFCNLHLGEKSPWIKNNAVLALLKRSTLKIGKMYSVPAALVVR